MDMDFVVGVEVEMGHSEDSSSLLEVEHFFCKLTAGVLCELGVATVVGNGMLDSPAAILKYSDHFPLGTSVKDLQHFSQLITSNKFQAFDYGPAGNEVEYGTSQPPSYNISRFNISSALFFGEDDDFVRPGDRDRLVATLPPGVIFWSKIYPRFSHVTWHVGFKSATMEFYNDLIKQLTATEKGNSYPTIMERGHDSALLNILV
eukprot:gnl/MRDRNA2_/MRDRNA2_34500_c0_seq2.p1 gnl/MRDRNA2_/MRDRNA2_34500_c0~~gnl/MRDRNA2_/MRDRNA2_34500_c0_seq2.p1  ORF type:complete len:204 (-),score=27.65 gnl/MRDRNA2_/MRDRNA2_34500_c0_seq2:49-660(-)